MGAALGKGNTAAEASVSQFSSEVDKPIRENNVNIPDVFDIENTHKLIDMNEAKKLEAASDENEITKDLKGESPGGLVKRAPVSKKSGKKKKKKKKRGKIQQKKKKKKKK